MITNIPTEKEETLDQNKTPTNEQKNFTYEFSTDPNRRSDRLRDVRKNLRDRYDEQTKSEAITQPINIPVERIIPTETPDPEIIELYDQTASKVKINDRKYRSRTLDNNQIRAVDNQIYGSSSPKSRSHQRVESHRHRSNHLSFRRSSEDIQDKQLQLRRHLDAGNTNETWMEVGKEHWTNLLENGWRPTMETPGINLVSFADSGKRNEKNPPEEIPWFSSRLDNYRFPKRKNEPPVIDLYEQVSRTEYASLFDQLDFAYTRTVDLGNEFWRFLEMHGNQHLCLYHQLNKQFILYKPDISVLSYPWPYDGIVDISWSKPTNTWVVATQTQIVNSRSILRCCLSIAFASV